MKGRKVSKASSTRVKSRSSSRSTQTTSSARHMAASLSSTFQTTSRGFKTSSASVQSSRTVAALSNKTVGATATASRRTVSTSFGSGFSSISAVSAPSMATANHSIRTKAVSGDFRPTISMSMAPPTTTSIRTNVTAALVKKLRDSTGAPMIECKKALTAVFDSDEYDTTTESAAMSSANEYLRKRGTALAAKNAGRTALEGAVAFVINKEKTKGVMLELNCETDFVARNGTFLGYASRTALTILGAPIPQFEVDPTMLGKKINVSEFQDSKLVPGPSAMPSNPDAQNNTIAQELIDVVNNCRENIKLRRAAIVNVEDGTDGFVAAYIHNELPIPEDFKPFHESINSEGYTLRLGNAGALGAFKLNKKPQTSIVNDDELLDLGRKIMMQTVAASPQYLHRSMVPSNLIDKEKEIMLAVTDTTGKDPKIVDRLIQGKLNKFFEGIVLLDQQFIVTNDVKKPTVSDLLKAHPSQPELVSVVRYSRGEAIEGEAPAEAPAQQ